MVKRCSYGTCNTDSRYLDRLENNVQFFPFPKPGRNLEKCIRWIRLCGRPHQQLNLDKLKNHGTAKHIYVCSKHFVDGQPTPEHPDPQPALAYDRTKPARRPPKLRAVSEPPKKRLRLDSMSDNAENIRLSACDGSLTIWKRGVRTGVPNYRTQHLSAPSLGMKKILVDVDCGVDDAQAIMMALGAPNVEILGITCVHGNTTVENVCKNSLRVLKACQKLEIPVFRGASKPILGKTLSAGHFHGQDGLGDVPDPDAPGPEMIQKEGAVAAMIRIANEHAGELSLVATAPLTNLALAVRIDPTFPQKLKALYIMGGNTDARGNTTMCAEFNFAADPEAAYIVLNDFLCPTYIACWEFTCRNKLPWEFCDTWLAQDSDKARFMKRIFQHSMDVAYSERSQKEMVAGVGFVSCDSYAMAAAIDDSFVKECERVAVSVELTGTYSRGMMVVDTLDILKKDHKAFLMKTVDMERFKALIMDALK